MLLLYFFLSYFCYLVVYSFVFALYLSGAFHKMMSDASMSIDDVVSTKCVCGADKFDDFCHIRQSANAKITGIVAQLSLLKRGKTCNYSMER